MSKSNGIPSDNLPVWVLYLGMVATVLLVFFLVGANLFGPCSWLTWQPVKDVPARCLPGLVK